MHMNAVSTLLPVELYIAILAAIPSSKDDPSERTLLSCAQAHPLLRAAARSSAVWKTPYLVRYMHADAARERERRASLGENWRELYAARRRRDREGLALVAAIRTERSGRHARARQLVRGYGLDVWDALRAETRLALPAWVAAPGTAAAADGGEGEGVLPDVLPRRYWAQVALGVIARRGMVDTFVRAAVADQRAVDFETALASLSAFFDVSVQEVNGQLEEVCGACKAQLIAEGIPLDPHEPNYDFWNLCVKIRDAIHGLGFGVADGSNFHRVMNQFPHFFLQPTNRRTIPMSLVYVYVAVARRLGIAASPANFPGVVQVHIQPPDGEPFRLLDMRGTEPPSANPALLYPALGLLTPHADAEDFLHPAAPATMLLRSCNNIRAFMNHEISHSTMTSHDLYYSALYGVSCWLVIQGQVNHAPPTPPDTKPLDYTAVLLDALCPKITHPIGPAVAAHYEGRVEEEEQQARDVKMRSLSPNVQFFVGLPMVHKRYNYAGIIYGWDSTCLASEGWIQTMQVDSLAHGRHQPFYHVLPVDGQPRYVAQENITPAQSTQWSAIHRTHPSFSRYFTGVEQDSVMGHARLKVSQELLDAYPDDDSFGASWIRTDNTQVVADAEFSS